MEKGCKVEMRLMLLNLPHYLGHTSSQYAAHIKENLSKAIGSRSF